MMGKKYKTYRRETAQWGHTNGSYTVRKSRALQKIYKNKMNSIKNLRISWLLVPGKFLQQDLKFIKEPGISLNC